MRLRRQDLGDVVDLAVLEAAPEGDVEVADRGRHGGVGDLGPGARVDVVEAGHEVVHGGPDRVDVGHGGSSSGSLVGSRRYRSRPR